MELPTNQFKRNLSSDKTQYGLWLGLPDPSVAEICAGAGFDWLLIDGEHAPFDLSSLSAHLRAVAPYPVTPIARPPIGETHLIKQYLDLGVQTLLIPMVETGEQAAELVRATRYPPDGVRGVGAALARASRWNNIPGYLESANREICLIVQVESKAALQRVPEIAATDVDAVFVGPADLAASMGHTGKMREPEVVDAIKNALSEIRSAGKAAGILCVDPAHVDDYEGAGANFIGVGVDTLVLSQGVNALAARYK